MAHLPEGPYCFAKTWVGAGKLKRRRNHQAANVAAVRNGIPGHELARRSSTLRLDFSTAHGSTGLDDAL
jgi:hypothetical protein